MSEPGLPRVTVITPNLNQGQFLERTICSVLDQGYENLEYLVVDGGSSDNSVEVIKLYADELAWWCSEEDAGPADAINKALKRATGDIVVVLSADDVLLPMALHAAVQRLSQTGAPRWLVGGWMAIGPDDQLLGRGQAKSPASLAAYLMHNSSELPFSASFFRRELLAEHGALDAQLTFAFDYEFCCRLLAAGEKPAVAADLVAARREHADRRSAVHMLRQGMEYITAARRYAGCLTLAQRYALWRNCDCRERIYALAEAEVHGPQARRFLLPFVLRRPWWLTDSSLRHTLVHGVAHPAPRELAA